jgi:branched-chain amino acid transport system ATP-binding protein
MPPDALLEVRGLTRRFGGVLAVDDLSFTVRPGELVSLIGPNGAGKTTVFNCLSGLVPPTAGSMTFAGRELNGLRADQVAHLGIARTFQNLELFANATTLENLLLGRHVHMRTGVWGGITMLWRGSRAAREEVAHRERVEEIIERLGLEAERHRRVADLPYGARKLVELGRALALEPRLLLLDEPTAGMTAEERQDMIWWIRDLRAELGLTVLMIEHHMELVLGISDRVVVLDFGRRIAEGAPDEVARHPDVIRAYLGEEAVDAPAA